ncbi:MAG: hypothetical protein R2789_10380 [Microthrixaceae bacterium]
MFPFLMNFSLPIAALLGIWWHLDALESSAAQPDGSTARTQPPPAGGVAFGSCWPSPERSQVAALAVAVELVLRRSPSAPGWRGLFRWPVGDLVAGTPRSETEISTDVGQVVPYFLRMLCRPGPPRSARECR